MYFFKRKGRVLTYFITLCIFFSTESSFNSNIWVPTLFLTLAVFLIFFIFIFFYFYFYLFIFFKVKIEFLPLFFFKSKERALTFCLTMWFFSKVRYLFPYPWDIFLKFWKVRIEFLPFALPCLFVWMSVWIESHGEQKVRTQFLLSFYFFIYIITCRLLSTVDSIHHIRIYHISYTSFIDLSRLIG